MSPASVVCAIIAPAWSTAWRAICPWVSWERTVARSASWRVESLVWAFSVRLACTVARSLGADVLLPLLERPDRAGDIAVRAQRGLEVLERDQRGAEDRIAAGADSHPFARRRADLDGEVPRRAVVRAVGVVAGVIGARKRGLRVEGEAAEEPPSGQLGVGDAGERLEESVHLLSRRRAVAGRHRAIGLLGGDLLRPGHDLHGVAERAVLGAEHAQAELHRARVLRERAERRRGAQHLTRGERVGVGGLEALAARDLALERGERRLEARRVGAELVEDLDVGDAGDHETICMSSSSVLLTTEMTWAEAWKACWKLSRLVSSSLRFTPESASRWFCTCWRTPWLAVASPCACRASSPRRAVALAA